MSVFLSPENYASMFSESVLIFLKYSDSFDVSISIIDKVFYLKSLVCTESTN